MEASPSRTLTRQKTFRSLEEFQDMEHITKKEFDKIPEDYKGRFLDFYGTHPEWKGRRTAFLPGHGTTLFVEGVSFEIVDDAKGARQ